MLAYRDGVRWLIALHQRADRLEDQTMVIAIEIVGGHHVRYLIPRVVRQHETAEQGLLGLHGMWR